MPFGEFLALSYLQEGLERQWLGYLVEEARRGGGRIAHQDEREALLRRMVGDIRDRQNAGRIDSDLDPALVYLMAFALTTYPWTFENVTRVVTEHSSDDSDFQDRWTRFLRELGHRMGPADSRQHDRPSSLFSRMRRSDRRQGS